MSVFGLNKEEKTAVFIDGANTYGAYKALGFDMDFKQLIGMLKRDTRLIRAYYYTAVDDTVETPIRPLVDWLDYNGFSVHTKQTKGFTDAQGRTKTKGNIEVELAVDMVELAHSPGGVDHILLFSGNGDYAHAVQAVQRCGVRVTVVSALLNSIGQPPMIADDLRRKADAFVDLGDISDSIRRDRPERVEPRSYEGVTVQRTARSIVNPARTRAIG